MIVLWVTLFVLHQGYSLVPVITVQLGEPVTFTCVLPKEELSSRKIHWYKQSNGDNLKLIATLWKSTTEYAPNFKSSVEAKSSKNFSSVTILKTTGEDEGMYHCGVTEWINTEWSGTYLSVKGNNERTSNYTVVQRSTVSDPVRPGDSVTLQCSVLSDSDNKTCPGDHSVYWFRAGSDKSHPHIIYTDGNDECEKRADSLKSCGYRFSKTISSSDAGTYYCAVATCGQILFGNGTNLQIDQTTHSVFTAEVILIVFLTISVVGNVVLIYNQRVHGQRKGIEGTISEAQHNNVHQPVQEITQAEAKLSYAALNFSGRKSRGQMKRDFSEDSVYSHIN